MNKYICVCIYIYIFRCKNKPINIRYVCLCVLCMCLYISLCIFSVHMRSRCQIRGLPVSQPVSDKFCFMRFKWYYNHNWVIWWFLNSGPSTVRLYLHSYKTSYSQGPLLSTWINFNPSINTCQVKYGMKLLIYSRTSTVAPLKFGNG